VSRVRAACVLTACSALALLASGAAELACGSSDATAILVPITGVTVRAESITTGLGCGRASTQIFKYAVVVLGPNPMALGTFDTPLAGNVYDCFSDGLFVNLPATAGSTDYRLNVYAYNAQAYEAATDAKIRAALAGANLTTLAGTSPTFTTTCNATEIPDVQSLAVCQPLVAGMTGAPTPPAPATAVPRRAVSTTPRSAIARSPRRAPPVPSPTWPAARSRPPESRFLPSSRPRRTASRSRFSAPTAAPSVRRPAAQTRAPG
jgi:hypothetical protein